MSTSLSPEQALHLAIEHVGGDSKMAGHVGVTRGAIYFWRKVGRTPAERVLEVERATGGLVSRYQLRPDLYPEPQPATQGT